MRLFIDALCSTAEKGLISWLSIVMSYFPIGILGQVWYLIVSISDLYPIYFYSVPYILSQSSNAMRKGPDFYDQCV